MEKRDGIALFANDRRQNENQPVMRGVLTLAGVEYEVALWGKTSKKGTKYWGGEVKLKEDRPAPAKAPDDDFGDSEIPF